MTTTGDPLEGIARLRVPTRWSYRGPMTFVGEGVHIDGDDDSKVAITDADPEDKRYQICRVKTTRGTWLVICDALTVAPE